METPYYDTKYTKPIVSNTHGVTEWGGCTKKYVTLICIVLLYVYCVFLYPVCTLILPFRYTFYISYVKITNNGTAVFILRLQLHRRYYSQEISLAGLLTHDNNDVYPAAVTMHRTVVQEISGQKKTFIDHIILFNVNAVYSSRILYWLHYFRIRVVFIGSASENKCRYPIVGFILNISKI